MFDNHSRSPTRFAGANRDKNRECRGKYRRRRGEARRKQRHTIRIPQFRQIHNILCWKKGAVPSEEKMIVELTPLKEHKGAVWV